MYATIRQVRPTDPTELSRRVREQQVVQRFSKIPGFVAYQVVEGADGAWVSISIFETEAGARESTRVALEWGNEHAADITSEEPTVITGPVAITRIDQPGRLAA